MPKNAYAEISGQNSINKDFKELTGNLMTLFAFHDYNVIKECSKNVFTGEPLPERMHKQLVEGEFDWKTFEPGLIRSIIMLLDQYEPEN